MMQKTDTAKSPLLKPVIERDYTKGLAVDPGPAAQEPVKKEPEPGAGTKGQEPLPGAPKIGAAEQKFNIPDDTKEFSFDDIQPGASDVTDEDSGAGVNISTASAKTFANWVGGAIQLYVPKYSYSICKVDINNIAAHIAKGNLTSNWYDVFDRVNKNTEEGLKISDESIKLWKVAFKDWLESENIKFANPKNTLILATIALAAEQAIKIKEFMSANENLIRQALQHSNPDLFIRKSTDTDKTTKPEENGAGTKAA